MVMWSTVKSWVAIRKLRIDEHREWVIRAWSYQMAVITDRVVLVALLACVLIAGNFYQTMTCDEVAYVLADQQAYARDYPQCQPGSSGTEITHVSVKATTNTLGFTAALRLTFGASLWIAIWIHGFATEYYLFETKDESKRLRELFLKRQKIH
ncbi:hypothetical protein FRC08_009460 [Ceratobasidium sp. 394]|nr:hypothetical protein FRC08_009460 [Ceratobasidium sp. 394]